jgi:hypothetical protein
MKFKVLIVLLLMSPFYLSAQLISNYGIKVGVLSSKPVEVKREELFQDSRVSGTFGLFAQFLNFRYCRFEFEAGYKQEGAENKVPVTTIENPDGSGDYVTFDHAYDFISLNLSFQPKLENEDICLYGIVAASLNIMTKNRDMLSYGQNVDKYVPGYNYGLGFSPKNFLNGKIFVEMKYGSSFSKYLKGS